MKKVIASIPDYTPLPIEDLRAFPRYVSLFLSNIFIMIGALICTVPPLFSIYSSEPSSYVIGILFGFTLATCIFCVLILRGHLTPVKLLAVFSFILTASALIALPFSDEKHYSTLIIGALTALLSFFIVRSQKYYQVALFWKRMMDRQWETGLTRAEDLMIHLLLEEGTKDGLENARRMVINARKRIKKPEVV